MFTKKLQNLVLIVPVQHYVRQLSTTLLCQLRQTVKSLETKEDMIFFTLLITTVWFKNPCQVVLFDFIHHHELGLYHKLFVCGLVCVIQIQHGVVR